MGKVLRVLVILLAILSIAATYFAYQNYNKREVLIGRTHTLEEMVIKISGMLEAEDLPETPQPSYPSRDISAVTSREIENPERSAFWDSYNHKFEPPAATPPMLNLGGSDSRRQLRTYYRKDGDGKYIIDEFTGKPTTKGEGTMSALLDQVYERAKAQYTMLISTRAELPRLRDELINTIEELNSLKQAARTDKRIIEERDARIAELESQKRDLESKISSLNDQIKELEEKEAELTSQISEKEDEIVQLNDTVKRLQQQVDELKGRGSIAIGEGMVATTTETPAEGVLTPGNKGKIVSANDEWKYAIVAFSPEFMNDLIGVDRNKAMPQIEVMVRRPDVEDPDQAFVTRLRLRQVIRGKDLVIADILSDWQQKPVKVNDIVFF